MSLVLDFSKPDGLEIKTYGFGGVGQTVFLRDGHNIYCEINLGDFLIAAHYVLTNTDLDINDPRRQFVKCVQAMTQIKGFDKGGLRLWSTEPPLLKP